MDCKLFNILERFESSFSRKITYHLFILLIIGLIVRGDHYHIVELYCRRSAIENTFSVLKTRIGGLAYRFYSKLTEKGSRQPKKNKDKHSNPQKAPVEAIEHKVRAIEMFCKFFRHFGRCFNWLPD